MNTNFHFITMLITILTCILITSLVISSISGRVDVRIQEHLNINNVDGEAIKSMGMNRKLKGNENLISNNIRFYIQDLMVQGICSGSGDGFDMWVYAIRRECNSSSSRTCDDICKDPKITEQDPDLADTEGHCFGAFRVYHDRPIIEKDEMLGPKTFVYRGCDIPGCGPNYCCCQYRPRHAIDGKRRKS